MFPRRRRLDGMKRKKSSGAQLQHQSGKAQLRLPGAFLEVQHTSKRLFSPKSSNTPHFPRTRRVLGAGARSRPVYYKLIMETIRLRGVSFCIISAFCCCNGGERWQLATASSDAWWRKWGSPRNERGRGRIPPTPTTASRRVSQCPTSHGRHAWRKRPAGRLRISHYLILLRTSCQFKGSSWIRNGAYLIEG